MAHFALTNESGIVEVVIVVPSEALLDEDGNEQEKRGVEFCNKVAAQGHWVQTSYTDSFRRRYAGPGMTYSVQHDAFILPQPYPSWVLDLNEPDDWASPIAMPTDEGYWYEWDEQGQTWTPHKIEQVTP